MTQLTQVTHVTQPPEMADSINIVELAHAVRRGWRPLVVCTVLGVLAGVGVLTFGPRKFSGSANIVVRSTQAGGASSLLAKVGMAEGGAGGLLPPSPIETEIQIIGSRKLVGKVADSLRFQVEVTSPAGVASRSIVGEFRLPQSFKPAKYDVQRVAANQYKITGADVERTAAAGAAVVLPQGTIVLRADTTLPEHFKLRLLDREDAITESAKRLGVSKTSGEVIGVSFLAPDSMTAAVVPNALVAEYLAQRHTTDRGTNEHRVDFLTAQIDSVGRELARAEDSLRRFQEATGVVAPEIQGKLQLDRAAEIRKDIGVIDVESGALGLLMSQIGAGKATPSALAAYPTFQKSAGVNTLLSQLSTLGTERTQLLERRLESDPEVMALAQSIKNIEQQLMNQANSYKLSLDRQRIDLGSQLDTISRALGVFPGRLESSGRLQRGALRLAQTHAALQVQLVEARLAAIGEGGNVRPLDVAMPPKKVASPRPVTTMGLGLGGGLLVGLALALFVGLLGRWVEDPRAIERTTGVPALRMDAGVPLLVAGRPTSNTLLLVPLSHRANTAGVAERLARTAIARATEPIILDLSGGGGNGGRSNVPALNGGDIGSTIQRLEQNHGMVIVRLPALTSDETAAALTPERAVLLVAPPGRVERSELVGAIQTLRRLNVPCAGVVMNRASDAIVAG